jgi:hypothetical protein
MRNTTKQAVRSRLKVSTRLFFQIEVKVAINFSEVSTLCQKFPEALLQKLSNPHRDFRGY